MHQTHRPCIDGYSRFIVYLRAATDKLAETVRDIFVTACDSICFSLSIGS